MAIIDGKKYIFVYGDPTPFPHEPELAKRSGQTVTVICASLINEYDEIADFGCWHIEFEDGLRKIAYRDELLDCVCA